MIKAVVYDVFRTAVPSLYSPAHRRAYVHIVNVFSFHINVIKSTGKKMPLITSFQLGNDVCIQRLHPTGGVRWHEFNWHDLRRCKGLRLSVARAFVYHLQSIPANLLSNMLIDSLYPCKKNFIFIQAFLLLRYSKTGS